MKKTQRSLALLLTVVLCACIFAPNGITVAAEGPSLSNDAGVPKTARAFLAQLETGPDQSVGLFDSGTEVQPDALVAIGQTLRFYDSDGVLVNIRDIVVLGRTNA